MKKIYLLSVCLLFLTGWLYAQERTVTGKVTSSADNGPLPGVTVVVKGSTRGGATDASGKYSLTAPDNATLVFSFVGFVTQEVPVGGRSVVDVTLATDINELSEIVVTGYGAQIKRELTGNIAKVSGSTIQNTPVPSVEQAIQGRAAGVFIESGNGKVGQGIKVRIRGSSSVTASNDPLYVIDGVVVTSQSQSTTSAATNPLADLNFNDVESIEILKDASASAIYGSRASNGVVLITTKRGKSGKTSFNLNYFTGFSQPTRRREWLNTQEYIELFREASTNSGLGPEYAEVRFTRYAAGNREAWENPSSPNYVSTDWQDQVFRNGSINQADISASGGNDKTRFYASGSWSNQQGILIRNAFERISGRLNVDHKATEKLTLGLNFNIARTVNDRLSDDNAFSTPMQIVALPPMTPVIDPRSGLISGILDTARGAPNTNFPLYYNPLIDKDNTSRPTTIFRNIGNVFASYAFIPGLTFRSEFGYDLLSQNEKRYFGRATFRNSSAANGLSQTTWTQVFNFTTNNYLSFAKTFAERHTLEAVAGMTYQQSQTDYSFVEGQQFPSDSYKQTVSAGNITGGSTEETGFSFLSYFARLNYKFNDRYLLGLSGRLDGSSRFGSNNRYGFFPALSVGWIVTEEEFLKGFTALSFLKVRASIGLTGNAEIGNFVSRGLFSGGGYATIPRQYPVQLPNPDLKWEQTTQTDIGIDFGFFNNRLSGEIDYYEKNTNDLLLNVNVPATSGIQASQLRNIGSLRNRGFELVLNTQNLTGALQWNTSFNFARNINRIINIDGQVIEGGFLNRAVEGQPIGVFFGPEYAGVDPQNGDALYYLNTLNTDGSRDRGTTNNVNDAQRVVIGNPNPDFIAGITNNLSYKGIELSFLFQGVFGNDIYNGGGKFQSANGDFFDNQTKDQLRRWRNPGDITDVPQARLFGANGTAESSRYLSDGTYVRLKNVTLAYNLPSGILSKVRLDKVRVYVTAQNLLTFTKYTGWDPEVNADYISGNISQGNDFYSAPQPRTITFGLNVGF